MHNVTVVGCFEHVAGWAEVAVERFEDGQETLGVPRRLETLQYSLSSPGSLVRVLSTVVEVAALTVFGVG